MKIIVNPKYERFRPFVGQLTCPGFFARHGETLHEGRNVIKRFEVDGVALAVKSYERLSLFNRFAYGLLRKSKAMRAGLHARKLRERGIGTPEEVAVVEVRKHGLMRQCYFVSLCSDYKPLHPVTDLLLPWDETRPILDALAGFLERMHSAGVLHKDLNIGNILYAQDASGEYRFCVIDTNRMSFRRRISMRRRLRNLRRLSCGAPAYLYILQQYAGIRRADVWTVSLEGAVRRLLFERRQHTKWKVKSLIRRRRGAAESESVPAEDGTEERPGTHNPAGL